LADAGNLLGFTGIGQGIVDIVINVYEDSFDPTSPELNRVASIDEGSVIALETGSNYILVVQPYCENTSGVFAVVVRGSGVISGAGFESVAYSHGQHSPADGLAEFPLDIGVRSYDVSGPVQVPRTGIYYFGDVGINFNADLTLLVYEGFFNPNDTSNNLAGAASFAGTLTLDKNKTYVFVMVDQDDLQGNWQFVLFPPGAVRFNENLKGAWVTPGVQGSGVMMEIGTQTGVLFFAWFTFPEPPPPVLQAKPGTRLDSSDSRLNADLGSSDQRWLTAFGVIDPNSSIVNINYENTTGGFFDSTTPVPATDSNYGSGTVEVIDCNKLVISYELPGGVAGSASMVRIIPDGEIACLESVDAAVIVQE
jgi:hypothetical protein